MFGGIQPAFDWWPRFVPVLWALTFDFAQGRLWDQGISAWRHPALACPGRAPSAPIRYLLFLFLAVPSRAVQYTWTAGRV